MFSVLLIEEDRAFTQRLSLAFLERGLTVRTTETFCEGVRFLTDTPVAAILMDAGCLRLRGPEQVRLFDQIAPGVPVVILVPPAMSPAERIALELLGFSVMAMPLEVEDLLAKIEALAPGINGGGHRVLEMR